MNQLEILTARFLDVAISPDETRELARLLQEDPSQARNFAELFFQSRALEAHYRQSTEMAMDAIMSELVDDQHGFVRDVMQEVRGKRKRHERVDHPAKSRWSTWNWIVEFPKWGYAGLILTSLLLAFGLWFFYPTMGEPVLAEVRGIEAGIERTSGFVPARPGTKVLPGDVLRTRTDGILQLAFGMEPTRLDLAPGSELRIASSSPAKLFVLQTGRLTNSVARQPPFRPMVIRTPHAEARVLGTKFVLAVSADASQLDVTEGMVRLTRASDGQSVTVKSGQSARAAAGVELSALPRTGGVLREYWTNIIGDHVSQLDRHRASHPAPDGMEILTNLVVRTDWGDNFGDLIRGYVHPPVTGQYTFWISGDSSSTLNLSRTEKPEDCTQLAITETEGGSSPEDWDSRPVQRSSPLTLVAGRRYYIEVIRKTNQGLDHLAVAWQPPGRVREIIQGAFLSPYKPDE